MKKKLYVLFGIMLLLTLYSAVAATQPPPILPPPTPIKEKITGSHGWVDEIFGNEAHFAEIKANLWKFSQYSSRETKDITGTNHILYSLKYSYVSFDKDFFVDYYKQYKVKSI